MTSEEILKKIGLIKERIKNSGGYILLFNTDIVINSNSSFIIWDDKNMVVHAITENNNATGTSVIDQARLPYKIKTIPYETLVLTTMLYDSLPETES